MKKIAFIMALVGILALAGCQKNINNSEVYAFPNSAAQITGSFYSQGEVNPFEVATDDFADLSKWFYGLELTACDEPEAVEGAESYSFDVDNENAFTYENRGSEAYIIIDQNYYRVGNPSNPPID